LISQDFAHGRRQKQREFILAEDDLLQALQLRMVEVVDNCDINPTGPQLGETLERFQISD